LLTVGLEIIGLNLINIKMKNQNEKSKKNNPMAKDLRTPKYKQKTIKSKKIYNRKKKSSI